MEGRQWVLGREIVTVTHVCPSLPIFRIQGNLEMVSEDSPFGLSVTHGPPAKSGLLVLLQMKFSWSASVPVHLHTVYGRAEGWQ